MKRSARSVLALLSACLAFTLPTLPAAELSRSELVGPLSLRQESIEQALALLELLTGRTVLRGPGLPNAALSLELAQPLPRGEAIQAVEALLTLNGVAVTPMGDRFLKALPVAASRAEVAGFIEGSALTLPPSGQIASKLFVLKLLRAQEFQQQITGLINGAIPPVLFEKANAVLVTDTISTLQRIELIQNRIDRPDTVSAQLRYLPLRNAKASELASRLTSMVSSPPLNAIVPPTTILHDDRTNQLIVALDDHTFTLFQNLVARLDDKTESFLQNDVIPLKNANAKEVAALLGQLSGQRMSATVTTASPRPTTSSPTPSTPTPPPHAPAAQPPAAITTSIGTDSPSANFSELLAIVPDERSNALVVMGTPQDLRLVRELVTKVDVLLAQVRIEVVIAEVTLSDAATSGISELGLKIEGSKLAGFSATTAGGAITDATLSIPGPGETDLAATITASTTPRKGNTRILSVPNIVTTHNKEATIFVGESRPVISSYLQDGSSSTTSYGGYRTSVSNTEIGMELIVLPLIGHDGTVQLTIEQEVSDVTGTVQIDGNEQPIIGKRRTKSFVSVRDGEIVVLGGLQRAQRTRSTSRLGPIPIVGDLLGSRKREESRTDLVFFLRPKILQNSTEADAREFLQRNSQDTEIRRALGEEPAPAKRR